ncbi:MAG: lysophospholipid acyltransferase family protein [Mycobacteriales bacterium]
MYAVLKWIFIGPILRLLFRPIVEGLENVPSKGPAILASNHLSFSDSIFLPLVVSRKITFIAKMEYVTGKGVKGWLSRFFFQGVGVLPIDRNDTSKARDTLEAAQQKVLAEGKLLGIYPEGTRSPDGRLYKGKVGVARLALATGAPVVPVAMMNTLEIQPTGKILPRIMRVHIKIGKPLDFSRYEGMAGDRFVERSMTDEIMYELMQLSGQEYVDVYAAKVKAEKAAKSADKSGKPGGEAGAPDDRQPTALAS